MTITRNFSVLANGAGSANNLSLGGATLGTNALAVTGTASISGSAYIGNLPGRNRIINGNVSVDQRNAGASQTFTAGGSVAYCVDRFYASCTGANITGQRVAGTAPYQYAYKFTGATSNTATLFGQRIESLNIADLVSTTVVGQAQIASSTITTVTWTAYYANTANTFSSKTSIATGTITTTSTPTIYSFSFNAGSSAANGVAIEFTTGALVAAATLQYSGVQLEAGTIATPYEFNQYQAQLAKCQRYFYRISGAGDLPINYYTSSQVGTCFALPTTMRATPSCSTTVGAFYTVYRNGGANSVTYFNVDSPSPSYASLYNDTEASGTGGMAGIVRIAGGAFSMSAEL